MATPGSSDIGRSGRRQDRRRHRRRMLALAAVIAIVVVALGVGAMAFTGGGGSDKPVATATTTSTMPPTTTTTKPPYTGWVDPESAFQPFYKSTVQGLLTFRGNPTRNYYGKGPVPTAPKVVWQYPGAAMCSLSEDRGATTQWCGNGWTGEPAVFEKDGRTWVVFGAYDRAVHFVDGVTGQDILPPFVTGDIIKGSVSIDPDGYPLVYIGSRDAYFRVLAIDRPQATELWKLHAKDVSPTMWNDDWDGSGLVLNDYLFEGGENSQIHIVKLNRATGADGLVTVAPQLVWHAPGWDDELIANAGNEVSIENSVAISGNTLYFANSGGLVQGWDISGLLSGTMPTRIFRFWTGDDTDVSVVIDEQGMLYGGSEWERHNAQGKAVGQMWKLNPAVPDTPLVWSQHDELGDKSGVFGTPGIFNDLVVYTTYSGRVVVGVDRTTGAIRWEKKMAAPVMGSPVFVDNRMIIGDCAGNLHVYDVTNTLIDPPEVWSVPLGSCIEATPAVWNGRIYVGTRGGLEYCLADTLA